MKFGYTIVYVASVSETLGFYERAFGFQKGFLHESGEYGELVTGETTLAFASLAMGTHNFQEKYFPVSPDTLPPGIELAFVTENVTAAYRKSIVEGAIPLQEPVEKPWGQTVAYVRSLEGTIIELCSPIN